MDWAKLTASGLTDRIADSKTVLEGSKQRHEEAAQLGPDPKLTGHHAAQQRQRHVPAAGRDDRSHCDRIHLRQGDLIPSYPGVPSTQEMAIPYRP